jgi:hypothetical protein
MSFESLDAARMDFDAAEEKWHADRSAIPLSEVGAKLDAYIRELAPIIGAELAGRFEMAWTAFMLKFEQGDPPQGSMSDGEWLEALGDSYDEFERVGDAFTAAREAVVERVRAIRRELAG